MRQSTTLVATLVAILGTAHVAAHPPDPCGARGATLPEERIELPNGVVMTVTTTLCAPSHEPHGGSTPDAPAQ